MIAIAYNRQNAHSSEYKNKRWRVYERSNNIESSFFQCAYYPGRGGCKLLKL